MPAEDPTIAEVWDTIPELMKKDFAKIIDAIVTKRRRPKVHISKDFFEHTLNEDQKTAVYYLFAMAQEGYAHSVLWDYIDEYHKEIKEPRKEKRMNFNFATMSDEELLAIQKALNAEKVTRGGLGLHKYDLKRPGEEWYNMITDACKAKGETDESLEYRTKHPYFLIINEMFTLCDYTCENYFIKDTSNKNGGIKSQCISKFGGSTVIEHHEEYKAMWDEMVQVVDKYLHIMQEKREGKKE